MKVILIRSKTTDSAIFKVADTLFKAGYNVELLVWDRQNTLNCKEYPYKINKFDLKAPYDSFWALLYLPVWWVYEFIFLMRNKYDLIHACDLDTLWPAIFAKSLKKAKLFYTIYDFYADNIPKLPQFVRSIISLLEKKGIKFSDTLFLVDEARYEQVKGSKIKKLIYLYNSPKDLFLYSKLKRSNEYNPKLVVFYAGSLDKSRGMKYMINSVKEMKSIHLIIAGEGNDKKMVKESSINNENISYLGWLDHSDVLEMSLQADVLFAFYDPSIPNNRYASPNKLFEAMMCGKPIIMNSETSASKIVQEENCGIVFEYANIESIKMALTQLQNCDLREKLGTNGRRAYETKYNWKFMENQLLSVYNDCNKNKSEGI